jgi:hypothetical protein
MSPQAKLVTLETDPRRLVWRLATVWVGIELGLILLDYHVNYGGPHWIGAIRRMTNMAREDSLANLLAVLQMGLLGMTCWAVWLTVGKAGAAAWQRRGWAVVAAFFTYMTIDDGARIHERTGSAAKAVLQGWSFARGQEFADLFPSYTWQLVYLPAFGLLGMFTLFFLWSELRPKYSRLMVFCGIGCYVVAVGMDFFEGLDPEHRYNPYRWLADNVEATQFARERFHQTAFESYRHFSKVFEEALEMFGTTLLWMAILRHWLTDFDGLRIRFGSD